jgi:Flp pilus assembly pilin Flp
MLQGMGGEPGTPATPFSQPRFSADGFWWWDGTAWKPALSEDRLWRWNGQAWQAAHLPTHSSGAGAAAAIGIAFGFVGILVLVSVVVIVILLTMGNQISNVFSNVVAALNGP